MTSTHFDHIAIIFNPNSTGDAPRLASDLFASISEHGSIPLKPVLMPTEHAGHAEELAHALSSKYRRPLIVSVSGDGGYHEVINGAMRAKNTRKHARPVVAVVGAGNANDHQRVMRGSTPLVTLIAANKPKQLDLLQMRVTAHNFHLDRYAHSYIGFGLTPEVAFELNRHSLTLLREIRLVIKTFVRFKSFTVEHEHARREVDSLIFANINEMAKVIKLASHRNVTDNHFDVIEFPHRNKFWLLIAMVRAAVVGIKDAPKYQTYSFRLFDSHPVQCDGEVEQLPKRSNVTINSVSAAIESLF